MKKVPEYLKINDDNIVITLKKGVEIDGLVIKEITMREPTVQDNLAAQTAGKGSAPDTEMIMFANLCGVAPDDLKVLSLRDYNRIQAAFTNFID